MLRTSKSQAFKKLIITRTSGPLLYFIMASLSFFYRGKRGKKAEWE